MRAAAGATGVVRRRAELHHGPPSVHASGGRRPRVGLWRHVLVRETERGRSAVVAVLPGLALGLGGVVVVVVPPATVTARAFKRRDGDVPWHLRPRPRHGVQGSEVPHNVLVPDLDHLDGVGRDRELVALPHHWP